MTNIKTAAASAAIFFAGAASAFAQDADSIDYSAYCIETPYDFGRDAEFMTDFFNGVADFMSSPAKITKTPIDIQGTDHTVFRVVLDDINAELYVLHNSTNNHVCEMDESGYKTLVP